MNQWRALWAAMALWAFLGWLYVIMRLLMYPEIAFNEPFIEGLPFSFWLMGVCWYVIGLIATWRAQVNGSN